MNVLNVSQTENVQARSAAAPKSPFLAFPKVEPAMSTSPVTPTIADAPSRAARPQSTGQGRTRVPAWLQTSELATANAEYFASRDDLRTLSAEALRSRLKGLLKQEIGFIHNARFAEPAAGIEIFSETLALAPREEAADRRSTTAEMPAHLGRLCAAPLLTPDQERLLFERMNFLRHQATQFRSRLNAARPSRAQMELVERLLWLADWHRDRIVEANLRLVFSIVKKFVNQHNAFDDLLSDGIVALMRASDKFDFGRGFRFSTYATQVVRRDAYRSVVQKQEERQKVSSGLQDLGLDFSDEGRAPAMSEKRWHTLRSHLSVMLGDLDRREKLIVRARFALGSHRRVQTLQALADRLGVSKERVRQLEKRALEKLTAMAGNIDVGALEQEMA